MSHDRKANGQFKKGHHKPRAKARKSGGGTRTSTKTIVVRAAAPAVHRTKHRRKGRRSSGGGSSIDSIFKVIATGAAVGFLTADNAPVAAVRDFFANTVPGGKTFGPAATLGATALIVDKFLYKNKWLRIAGLVGIGVAAVRLGQQNVNIKWLGDVSDVEGDDDYDVQG